MKSNAVFSGLTAKRKFKVMVATGSSETRLQWFQLFQEVDMVEVVGWRSSGIETINDYPRLEAEIVFIDAVLDDITGFETGRCIKEQDRTVKVVVVSGIFSTTFQRYAQDLGLDAYLQGIPDPLFLQLLFRDLDKGKERYGLKGMLT